MAEITGKDGNMDKHDNELSLENLTMPVCFTDHSAMAEIKPHGGRCMGNAEIKALRRDYSSGMKRVNQCIYDGCVYSDLGLGLMKMRRMQFDRMMSLFDLNCDAACFEWLASHNKGDADVVDALVADALRTGKWKELPDVLQPVYHERKKAGS